MIFEIIDGQIKDLFNKNHKFIEEGDYLVQNITDPKLNGTKKVEWDVHSNYIACYSRRKLNLIHIETDHLEATIYKEVELDSTYLSDILDVQIDSKYEGNEGEIKCEIACKVMERNTIVFIDIDAD